MIILCRSLMLFSWLCFSASLAFADTNRDLRQGVWEKNYENVIKALENGADPNTSHDDLSILSWATHPAYFHYDIVSALIESGADPSLGKRQDIEKSYERILLGIAGRNEFRNGMRIVLGNRLNLIKVLVRHADLEAVDQNGETALVKAVREGHVEVVKILVQAGARTDVRSADNKSLIELTENHLSKPTYYEKIKDFLVTNITDS